MARDDQYVDDVEDQQADGLGSALVVLTTLILLTGFILVEQALATYGVGLFK